MNAIENQLRTRLRSALPGAAPGIRLQVYRRGGKICDIAEGETYRYYDLASLTKIVFTVVALMRAFEQGRWNLDSRVVEFWPTFPSPQVKLTDLLSHSGGALWWYPFFEELDLDATTNERRDWLKTKIESLEWKPTADSVYSDIGMLVLGFCLEDMLQKPLLEIWQNLKTELYPDLPTLAFHPENRAAEPQHLYAPTEQCPWRRRLLRGEVHDDNTWALGGVSTHAGLFSDINDLSRYGLFLRERLLGFSDKGLSSQTVKLFTAHRTGDWALGFMMPSQVNSSSGKHFSKASIGHTGFTGTSLWYDPRADLLVTILSNRVLLGRQRDDFKKLRPLIHDWIAEAIEDS